jgi:hypothetical protein
MSIENERGRKEKEKKTCFITWKSLFLFLLFYNYSFASAVQRRIEKLKYGSKGEKLRRICQIVW